MKPYTVIGVYEDTGEVLSHQLSANGPHDAMQQVASLRADSDLTILGAVLGNVELTAACEDSNRAASVTDLALCECGRKLTACATFEDPEVEHADS